MVLFYSRFIFDAFYGITVTIFLSLMIAANFNNLETINHFTLLSGLLVWNVGISQAVVALMISIERNMVSHEAADISRCKIAGNFHPHLLP